MEDYPFQSSRPASADGHFHRWLPKLSRPTAVKVSSTPKRCRGTCRARKHRRSDARLECSGERRKRGDTGVQDIELAGACPPTPRCGRHSKGASVAFAHDSVMGAGEAVEANSIDGHVGQASNTSCPGHAYRAFGVPARQIRFSGCDWVSSARWVGICAYSPSPPTQRLELTQGLHELDEAGCAHRPT